MSKVSIRCPYCTRDIVPTKSGHVAEHVTPGNRRCISVGLSWPVAVNIAAHNEEMAKPAWLRRMA